MNILYFVYETSWKNLNIWKTEAWDILQCAQQFETRKNAEMFTLLKYE